MQLKGYVVVAKWLVLPAPKLEVVGGGFICLVHPIFYDDVYLYRILKLHQLDEREVLSSIFTTSKLF